MKELNETSLVCDVLVVGGGAAALMAALEAKKHVSEVMVVSKGLIGKSGNTLVSGAGFSAFIPGLVPDDSAEQFYDDTMRGGKFINDEALVDILVRNSAKAIKDLEGYGVEFQRIDGEMVCRTPPGHSRPRSLPTVYAEEIFKIRGLSITLPLREAARQAQVRFVEGAPVVRLLQDDTIVCGAVAIDQRKGEVITVRAGAVVLATGGGGWIFAQTNNTRDVTGDGFALALEVGARLKDMEFVQFYPTMMKKPVKIPLSTPLFGAGAVLRNKNWEKFLARYDPAGDMATRDIMSRASFYEINAGNGVDGGVYLDCSGIPEEVVLKKYGVLEKFLARYGLDLRQHPLLVSPTTHFFMGGVKIDSQCGTGVPGLFVAGETAAGVHGANRLSSNALTETAVFGTLAGHSAALHAMKHRRLPSRPKKDVALTSGGEHLRDIIKRLRSTMWQNVSLVRSGQSLDKALSVIHECKAALGEGTAGQYADYLEVCRMVTVAEAVTLSAKVRRESRGSHFREDYPLQDDSQWLGNVEISMRGGEMQADFRVKNSL